MFIHYLVPPLIFLQFFLFSFPFGYQLSKIVSNDLSVMTSRMCHRKFIGVICSWLCIYLVLNWVEREFARKDICMRKFIYERRV
jgi:hypothetical protein